MKVRILGSSKWMKAGWKPLLKVWMDLLADYEHLGEGSPPDVAYWYGERALTGTLATAAWRANGRWWALEEFLGIRIAEGKGKASGRGDLWVGLGRDGNRRRQASFTIEAKASYVGRGMNGIVASIEGRLKAAKTQLRSLDREFSVGYPMAICYHIPPVLKRRAAARTSVAIFDEVTKTFAARPNTIVGAYWHDLSSAPAHGKWYYPGVILVGQVFTSLRGWRGIFERR